MLRSMYVTEFNNDVARIAVREPDAKGWREENIMKFAKATATDIWAGRLTPSRTTPARPILSSTVSRRRAAEAAQDGPASRQAVRLPLKDHFAWLYGCAPPGL